MSIRFLGLIILFLLPGGLIFAQTLSEKEQSDKYQACIASISEENSNAVITAKKWYVEGGGAAAQHCEAMALYDQNRFEEAAGLLEIIADKVSRGDGIGVFAIKNKTLLSAQLRYLAGNAWRANNKLERAFTIYTTALLSLDDHPVFKYDFYIERGTVQIDREDFQSALDDFSYALELDEERIEAFLYRAETYRKMNEHLKARLDLNQGLSIKPNQPDLLFESGINYRMLREDMKAKKEWQKLIDKFPDSDWQKLAEDNMKLISN
ncbi:tetratricopeptide repeat protein [Emcibacteraceae bacterium]|uniref:tetratricopeptide repeat protein n=1 Tax=Pseudemcibacter sp. TaxID=2943293 RepID=UPI00230D650D|nr:tetratricopeptide repeat protein [Emcibacteraceae bacterium]MDA9770369.1 tetratricopeptide repeat protein [Emcibacteraceae bacterium]MDG1022048.1 tetratricopeptide repeat protein [Emcibacteraceae bacterium]